MIKSFKKSLLELEFYHRDPFASDDDNEKGASAPVKIDVDLSLTAFANAKRYFDHKKQSSQKHLRTLEAGEKVRSHPVSHFPSSIHSLLGN